MSMESAVRNKDRVCAQTVYIIVYYECLLAVALVWVLVHSLSWRLEDSSKTFLLLESYTHNRTETAVPASHMQWIDEQVMRSKNMREVNKTKSEWLLCTLTC